MAFFRASAFPGACGWRPARPGLQCQMPYRGFPALCNSSAPQWWHVDGDSPALVTQQCDARPPPAEASHRPAVLWSCAGSGNTFTRAAIEIWTDRPTGSIYHESNSSFVAELRPVNTTRACTGLSVIKVHGAEFEAPWHASLCGGGVTRAIFLLRHPFRAALAEFQRWVAAGPAKDAPPMIPGTAQNMHTRRVDFNALRAISAWAIRAPGLARRWAQLVRCDNWRIGRPGSGCIKGDKSYGAWLASSPERRGLWVRYEDLTAPGDLGRAELARVIAFACPLCATRPVADHHRTHASTSWAHREQNSNGRPSIAEIIEARGAAATMWGHVSTYAPQFGYGRYNYDAIHRPDAPAKLAAAVREAERTAKRYSQSGLDSTGKLHQSIWLSKCSDAHQLAMHHLDLARGRLSG